MIPRNELPSTPGDILLSEFLEPLELTLTEFAKAIGISRVRLSEIVNGRRGITADTALRLERALGMPAQFWVNMQSNYDLAKAEIESRKKGTLKTIKLLNTAKARRAIMKREQGEGQKSA